MSTPIVIVLILIAPLAGLCGLALASGTRVDWRTGGWLGLAAAFVFFGAGHFIETDAMAGMLPEMVPHRRAIVLATGALELALAAGLLVPSLRLVSAVACAALLIGFFPANVYAAMVHAPFGGHAMGPQYLLVRGPLQVLLLGWAYVMVIRPSDRVRAVAAGDGGRSGAEPFALLRRRKQAQMP